MEICFPECMGVIYIPTYMLRHAVVVQLHPKCSSKYLRICIVSHKNYKKKKNALINGIRRLCNVFALILLCMRDQIRKFCCPSPHNNVSVFFDDILDFVGR